MAVLSPLKADCVIFDIDGVLMDSSESYPNVLREAIPRIWESVLGRKSGQSPFTIRHFETSKRFQALNDDYDICYGLLSLAASKKNDVLEDSFPTPWEWGEAMADQEESGTPFVQWVQETWGDSVPYQEVREICEEIYFGDEKTRELLNREPHFKGNSGLWTRERPLLQRHWSKISLPTGIYTGRTRQELSLALEALDWADLPAERSVCSDDGIKKPSAAGFSVLCRTMETSWPLFFGDSASDSTALKNFGSGDFIAIGAILKDSEFRFRSVEDAMRALGL